MKRILLLGDSIRMQYQFKVAELLSDNFLVYYHNENDRFSSFMYRMMYDYRNDVCDYKNIDLVYWNCGLWDVSHVYGDENNVVSISNYVENLSKIYSLLKKIIPNVKIVFATTTPVIEQRYDSVFYRINSEIIEYNSKAKEFFQNHDDVEVDDLYLFTSSWGEMAYKDATHFTDKYVNKIGKHVSDVIGKQFNINEKCCSNTALSERCKRNIVDQKKALVWGIGPHFRRYARQLMASYNITGLCDSNNNIWCEEVYGVRVKSPQCMLQDYDNIIVAAGTSRVKNEIIYQLTARGKKYCLLENLI